MAHATKAILVSLALAAVGVASGCKRHADTKLNTADDKALYGVGLVLGRNVGVFELTPRELEIVKAGLTDAVLKRPALIDLDNEGSKVNDLAQARQKARATMEKERSKGALEAAAHAPGAVTTASGVVIRTVAAGTGATPTPTDRVKVHYEGKLVDGTEFDNSRKRGEPATLPVSGVLGCWTEAFGRMKVGERVTLTCPAETAYGEAGRPPLVPGNAALVFDVELLGIEKGESLASAPPSPAAPGGPAHP
jgi:FKBP-type peptidyl-prolyl cis-trans isomerase FkpA